MKRPLLWLPLLAFAGLLAVFSALPTGSCDRR
jgi:hypothetical protein